MRNLGQLVVMAKNPNPGLVKTRLIPALGAAGACTLYRAMLKDVVDTMVQGPWSTTVAVSPASAVDELKSILGTNISVIPQIGDNLTDRMIHTFAVLFESQGPVVMRNSDSPDLPLSTIETAFHSLTQEDTDVVLGPDCGGGYYLVGLKTPCPDLFRLAMSTNDNFQQTLERCESLGLKVAKLAPHADIDEPSDLKGLCQILEATVDLCPNTQRALVDLGQLP